jgi:hypothetical protein
MALQNSGAIPEFTCITQVEPRESQHGVPAFARAGKGHCRGFGSRMRGFSEGGVNE